MRPMAAFFMPYSFLFLDRSIYYHDKKMIMIDNVTTFTYNKINVIHNIDALLLTYYEQNNHY